MVDGALAGLPRLVRLVDECRWRGATSIGTAIAVTGWWVASWLLEQPVEPVRAAISAAAVLLPTLALAVPAARRRAAAAAKEALPVPRGCVYETRASVRDRRRRLAAIVVTGVLALIVFDIVIGQAGVMAGLLAGLLAGTGIADRVEARTWTRAEAARGTRLFALIRHDALTVGFGPLRVVEDEAPLSHDPVEGAPSPFDLEV
jgi:hypothetical protein